MILRSIRWSLLFWYAVILAGALAALGWALLAEMERTLYRETDAQLAVWLATVRRAVEGVPAGGRARDVLLPPGATVSVWNAEGDPILGSPAASASAPPWPEGATTTGHVRVLRGRAEGGAWLQVGKDVEEAHHRVRDFLTVLLSASAAIIAVALGGGWILVGRSLSPVGRIAATARRISADNLTERIDTDRIQNELGGLARTLNACFDRLEDAIVRQSRFTADASHELRTPLAIVLSHLELAETHDRGEVRLRERIGIVREAAERMGTVVQGLLTLARADAGELRIERERVPLAAVVDDVLSAIRPLAARRGITISARTDPLSVPGDRDRLREVVTNLCANAVQYDRDGGTVTVTLAREGAHAVLRVADTGIGIAESDLPRVFDRFFRADAARSRARGGSGLGLAIARRLVELHGGAITATSRPDAGSVFTVRLPLAP